LQLIEDVHLVGGGAFSGMGLSSGGDCHVYLVDGGSELFLIDCGLGTSFEEIMSNVRADGFEPEQIKGLFLTHYHADHAGGASLFHERLGLWVAAGSDAAAALEAGDETVTSLALARSAGIFPPEYKLRPCPVADPLEDGATREIGRLRLQFIATPGHCHGHGSYLLTGGARSVLFAGDSVFWAGQLLLQAVPDCDLQASLKSILKLEPLGFDAFLPGHGALTLSGGHQHVEAAAKTIRSLGIPRNLV
jgi:glyoxylase-like metal-dependent hydrolase (beta-lactamase superfamily II)